MKDKDTQLRELKKVLQQKETEINRLQQELGRSKQVSVIDIDLIFPVSPGGYSFESDNASGRMFIKGQIKSLCAVHVRGVARISGGRGGGGGGGGGAGAGQ